MVEQEQEEPETSAATKARHMVYSTLGETQAVPFRSLKSPEYMRTQTGLNELDRVLGGGLVLGSVVLLSGDRYAMRWVRSAVCCMFPARNPKGKLRCAPSVCM